MLTVESLVGLIHVTVSVKVPGSNGTGYEGLFLVDTGATDSMAPARELAKIGLQPVGPTMQTC